MGRLQDTRPFPIQAGHVGRTEYPASTIPWWLAEIAYANYRRHWDQPLEQLANRGGFGREELVMGIRGLLGGSDDTKWEGVAQEVAGHPATPPPTSADG